MEEARIVAVYGRLVVAELDDGLRLCRAVGSLLRREGPLAAGDRVRVERSGDEGIVRALIPRTTALRRAPRRPGAPPQVIAANVERVVAVLAVREPPFRGGLADRIGVASSSCGIPWALCVNKWDLATDDDRAIVAPYEGLGVPVLRTSARTGEGIDALGALLGGHDSVVVGHSGVGKSSLLQRLVPGLELRVREVNQVTGRGRHTTTTATRVTLPGGGSLIDTPGIRAFGLAEVTPAELDRHLPEFAPFCDGCAFEDCAHDVEPDCAVREAVERGAIAEVRYEGYLRMLDSLREGRG